MTEVRRNARRFVLPLLVAVTGCTAGEPSLPELTPVEGKLLLDGQPLPYAKVMFNPVAGGLPANSAGTGQTDEKGQFTLTTAGKPGAVPGDHVVTIVEGPPPNDTRGGDAQEKLAQYQAGLKNRPIPVKFGSINTSNARLTITKDKTAYTVDLQR
jgi:hypothetical protein